MENIGHKYQESEARVHSKFDNIVPSICYPLGDTVILCLADLLTLVMQYKVTLNRK